MRKAGLPLVILFLYSCFTVNSSNEIATGIRQYENDSLKEAITTLSKVISRTDTCTNCFLYTGFAYKDLKQYENALKDFNSLISLDTSKAIGYANRASIYYLRKDYPSALTDLMTASRLDTNSIAFYNPISHMLFAIGRKDEACIYYNKALQVGDTTFDQSIKEYCDMKNNH